MNMKLAGKHLFIVEDSPMNRLIYQVMFVVHEARITFELYGDTTISRLQKMRHIDLIILDLMLPKGLSGFDIFQTIRALPEYNHVPIVAVSAMDSALAIPKARELGLNGFISKPIDDDLFPNQLVKIMEGEKVWYDGYTTETT